MLLSLDYTYGTKDDTALTLKDVIACEITTDKSYISKNITLDETINILSSNDQVLKDFFTKLSNGSSITALLKEYKTVNGDMVIDKEEAKKLAKYKCKKIVSDMIKEKVDGSFSLIKYSIEDNKLKYSIEMKKTTETDKILKTLRHIKRNKNSIVTKIKGFAEV